jgi:prepilin-type processing-associated H-X9-DG protein
VLISAWMILLRAQISGPAVNRWTQANNLAAARAAACSVLLPDGRVLVAGGNSQGGAVNTVDIMGTSGAFTPGPPMLQGRSNAACALLQDGTVLVAGGTDGKTALASAEIFTPSTNSWSSAGAMSTPRYGHTATVTKMGAVLLVGGQTGAGVTDQVEVFRPAIGAFTVLGKLSSARTDYAVAVIDQHRTLIAGGSDGSSAVNTLDIFDSYTNQVTNAGVMRSARRNFAAVTLLDGTVMFIGGYDGSGAALASTEIYDPAAQTSVAGPQLAGARAGHQAYMLPNNGSVIVFGGTDGQNTTVGRQVLHCGLNEQRADRFIHLADAPRWPGGRRRQQRGRLSGRRGNVCFCDGRDGQAGLRARQLGGVYGGRVEARRDGGLHRHRIPGGCAPYGIQRHGGGGLHRSGASGGDEYRQEPPGHEVPAESHGQPVAGRDDLHRRQRPDVGDL